ncbi:hypothetical protein [Nonomuraea sp. NPDC050643]|uniref:hypothetical protein n=1 Tax=Nonomuraea sp. NPDC050643 TaxID=3155660 RepID=UPI0033D8591A
MTVEVSVAADSPADTLREPCSRLPEEPGPRGRITITETPAGRLPQVLSDDGK